MCVHRCCILLLVVRPCGRPRGQVGAQLLNRVLKERRQSQPAPPLPTVVSRPVALRPLESIDASSTTLATMILPFIRVHPSSIGTALTQ